MNKNLLDAQTQLNALLNSANSYQYNPYNHPLTGAQQFIIGTGTGTAPTLYPPSPGGSLKGSSAIDMIASIELERLKKVDKEYIELLELLKDFTDKYVASEPKSEEEVNIICDFCDDLTNFLKRTK